MEDIVIVGFGGHAKSMADCIERMGVFRIIGYTDFENRHIKYEYLGTDDKLQAIYDSGVRKAAVGIGYLGKSELRCKVHNVLKKIGFELPIITDPSAIVANSAVVGEGTFIGKNAIINAEAKIGKMVIINTMALVEHECVVEDYSHIAVAAVLCGQVKVGKAAFIGANATVIQNMLIPEYKIVPAGITVR